MAKKNGTGKKLFSLFMSLVLVFGMMPLPANADDELGMDQSGSEVAGATTTAGGDGTSEATSETGDGTSGASSTAGGDGTSEATAEDDGDGTSEATAKADGDNATVEDEPDTSPVEADTSAEQNVIQVADWIGLQEAVNAAEADRVVKLSGNVICAEDQGCIRIEGENKSVTLDLNGYTLDRSLTSKREDGQAEGPDDGHVMAVRAGATLTIIDSSATQDNPGTGKITGGWSKVGGGIFVGRGATLNLKGGTIAGNYTSEHGAGIYVEGVSKEDESEDSNDGTVKKGATINLEGGTVTTNESKQAGAGIYVCEGAQKVSVQGSAAVQNNVVRSGSASEAESDGQASETDAPEAESTPKASDICLPSGFRLEVAEALEKDARIGIFAEGELGAFTEAYGLHNGDEDPALHFLSNQGYAVLLQDGEAVLASNDENNDGASTEGNEATTSQNPDGENSDDASKKSDADKKTNDDGKGNAPADSNGEKKDDESAGSNGKKKTSASTSVVTSPSFDALVTSQQDGVTTWNGLQEAVNAVSNGQTITLGSDIKSSNQRCIQVNNRKSFTIDLNGHTLNRNNGYFTPFGNVICVNEGSKLTITDSSESKKGKITGGFDTTGGGILVCGGAALKLQDGTIDGNEVNGLGGGVFVQAGGTFNMQGGTISGNSASGDGGGVFVDLGATMIFDGGTISGNTSGSDGGGICVVGTLKTTNADVTGGTIEDNTASETGGGIFVNEGVIELNNAKIKKNTADDDGGGVNVHLQEGSESYIQGGQISDNETDGDGGGLRMANDQILKVEKVIIKSNTADKGAGIYVQGGKVDVIGGKVQTNTASNGGGGIMVKAGMRLTANNVTISGNKTTGREGGGVKNYGTATLSGCSIVGNSAKKEGGGVYNDDYGISAGDMTLNQCTISNNTSNSDGGGVYNDNILAINGGTIGQSGTGEDPVDGNTAAARGGGVFIGGNARETSISGTIVMTGNTAAHGKDLYLQKNKRLELTGTIDGTRVGSLEMQESGVFTYGYSTWHPSEEGNNPASFFGTDSGAIPAIWTSDYTEATIKSDWPDLQTLIDAAADGANDNKVTLDHSYLASPEDVALYVPGGKTIIIDLNGYTINRNRMDEEIDGNVIKVLQGATLTVMDNSDSGTGKITGANTSFSLGSISSGIGGSSGGIYVGQGATLNLNSGTITGNKARENGGGIFVDMGGTLNMTGGTVAGNEAVCDGGGVFVNKDATFNFDAGTISGNTAGSDGGGISVQGTLTTTNSTVTGGTIEGNTAEETGGGIYVDTAAIKLNNVKIKDNTAGDDGGGINVHLDEDPDSYIKGSVISNNRTDGHGGGLRMDSQMSPFAERVLTVEDTVIQSNNADYAAGIYARRGTVKMIRGSIGSNTAANGGGGVEVRGTGTFTAEDVTISGNRANVEEGGGIKSFGTTVLTRCTISQNSTTQDGGGIYNNNNEESPADLTLVDCTISNNTAGRYGGGVFSSKKLSMTGSNNITQNTAANKGGGICLMGNETNIKDEVVVKDNTASVYGDNVYLGLEQKLTLTGKLTGNSVIGVDLETGTGKLTDQYTNQGNVSPEARFVVAKGYSVILEDGEAVIGNNWSELEEMVANAKDGDTITLTKDYAANSFEDRIMITDKKSITIDLNGFTINRNRVERVKNGHVLEVFKGSTLTIMDSSATQDNPGTGTIIGGWSKGGGGIYVNAGATLNLEAGTISGNKALLDGGGVFVVGTFNMKGGTITGNKSEGIAGGIYVDEGATLNFEAGTITGNKADEYGGGIYVDANDATATIKGSPVVNNNNASRGGNDVYLPTDTKLEVAGAFTDEANVSVALQGDWGTFTSGYRTNNSGKDPALYFVSTDGFTVFEKDGEAVLNKNNFGKTDYEDPFIEWNNQINSNTDALVGPNWMSGISGERQLNEINMPGAHDAGMTNVKPLPNTFDATGSIPAAFPHVGAAFATTQVNYIDEQLAQGARQLDIRLNNCRKARGEDGYYRWQNDGVNLWLCHGTSSKGGCYMASNPDDKDVSAYYPESPMGILVRDLSFVQVLDMVKDFLEKHPTETVILNIRPETPLSGEDGPIRERTKVILENNVLDINPSTGKPFLYQEEGRPTFAKYTHIPKLKDCRGQIVLLPKGEAFMNLIGGYSGDMFGTTYVNETDWTLTGTEKVDEINRLYSDLNPLVDGERQKVLPTDADTNLDYLWYWELNCTGENQGDINYAAYAAQAMDIDVGELGLAPKKIASYVNPNLIGEGKLLGPDLTGKYIGWIRMDAFGSEYAEPIWRTNFPELQYCTVTVESGLTGLSDSDSSNYPTQTYKVLKGTNITIPGNIYKNLPDDKNYDGWKASPAQTVDGEAEQVVDFVQGNTLKVTGDVTFTAQWAQEEQTPVNIVWKDGDDADGLRPDSVSLTVTTSDGGAGGSTSSQLELSASSARPWSGVVVGDVIEVVPNRDNDNWIQLETGDGHGTDTTGQYRYERTFGEDGGYTFTFIHTPQKKMDVAGCVDWDHGNNPTDQRPNGVTIRLFADGDEKAIQTVTAGNNNWEFNFTDLDQYADGEEINYRVTEDDVTGYSKFIDGFYVLNRYTADSPTSVEIGGYVEWDDANNRQDIRPEKVTLTLLRGGVQVDQREVITDSYSMQSFSFGEYPVNDALGQKIDYSITASEATGYKQPVVEEQNDSIFCALYTLDVSEEQKEDSEITENPKGLEPTYNGNEQTLVKKGFGTGGTMMYAVSQDNTAPPSKDSFSRQLPSATDAGTYFVWYYLKGDALHKDTDIASQPITATIQERSVTFWGKSDFEDYTGSQIQIQGVEEDGLVVGHTHNVTFVAQGIEAGDHEGTITPKSNVVVKSGEGQDAVDVTTNYDVKVENGTLTINPTSDMELEVTLEGATNVYDGKAHALSTAASTNEVSGTTTVEYAKKPAEGDPSEEDWTTDLSSLTATNVADSCTILVRATNPNYANVAEGTAELTVTPAEATITVADASKGRGQADPDFTGKVEGLVADGDLGEIKYVRTNNKEDVGTYEGVLDAQYTSNANYDVSVTKGNFTIKKLLTVRWLNGDDSVLQSKDYVEGESAPIYDGAEPTKAATAQYTYKFKGWDKGTVEGTVTIYKPEFSQTSVPTPDPDPEPDPDPTPDPTKKGTLTFDLGGGTLDGKTGSITIEANVGDTITIPDAPTKEGYTFQYWKGSEYYPGDKYTVEGDHTFTAVWEKDSGSGSSSTKKTTSGGTTSSGTTTTSGGTTGTTSSGTTSGGTTTTRTTTSSQTPKTADALDGAFMAASAMTVCGLCLVALGLRRRRA